MITRLIIGNFKAIQDPVEIELRPITLLFGPNAAGKSSILHALHYAIETLEDRPLDTHETRLGHGQVNLGGFSHFVHGRDTRRRVTIGFEQQWEGGLDSLVSGTDSDLTQVLRKRVNAHRIVWQVGVDPHESLLLVLQCDIEINHEPIASIQFISSKSDVSSVSGFSQQLKPLLAGMGLLIRLNLRHPIWQAEKKNASMSGPRMSPLQSLLKKASVPVSVSDGWAHMAIRYEKGATVRSGPDDALPRPGTRICLLAGAEKRTPSAAVARTRTHLQNILNTLLVDPISALHFTLAKTLHVGPLRSVPARDGGLINAPGGTPDAGGWYDGRYAWTFPTRASVDAGDVQRCISWVNAFLHQNDLMDSGFKLDVMRLRYFKDDSTLLTGDPRHAQKDARLSPAAAPDAFAALFDPNDNSFKRMTKKQLLARLRQIAQSARSLAAADHLILRDSRRGLTLTFHDVGVGISQVIPVLIAIFIPYPYPLRMIEQPELHLHPKAQVALGDALIVASACRNWRESFLIETHSEHMLLRLLRRIRETTSNRMSGDNLRRLQPDQISVIYVEPSAGGAKIRRLRVDDQGEFIDRWPQGFFEERAEELFS